MLKWMLFPRKTYWESVWRPGGLPPLIFYCFGTKLNPTNSWVAECQMYVRRSIVSSLNLTIVLTFIVKYLITFDANAQWSFFENCFVGNLSCLCKLFFPIFGNGIFFYLNLFLIEKWPTNYWQRFHKIYAIFERVCFVRSSR